MILPPIDIGNYADLYIAHALVAKVEKLAPTAFDSGRETWFQGGGAVVCPDDATWRQVWNRHVQNESFGSPRVGNLNPAPTFDFNKNVVVALFAGPTRGVVGYRLQSGFLLGKQGVVRLVPVVNNSATNNIALPSPWAFIALPRSQARVEIKVPRGEGWATVITVPPTLAPSVS